VSRVRGASDPSRGIGIAGTPGSPVRASATGLVAVSGNFEGFGPTVILGHGGGYYSLYLFLQQTDVRQGEVVTSGQPIGTMDGTDERPFFEFQIREESGTAVDPLPWLRSR
jgi:septal ring factor EnvC (AmiA/AmiB activator)